MPQGRPLTSTATTNPATPADVLDVINELKRWAGIGGEEVAAGQDPGLAIVESLTANTANELAVTWGAPERNPAEELAGDLLLGPTDFTPTQSSPSPI